MMRRPVSPGISGCDVSVRIAETALSVSVSIVNSSLQDLTVQSALPTPGRVQPAVLDFSPCTCLPRNRILRVPNGGHHTTLYSYEPHLTPAPCSGSDLGGLHPCHLT